MRDFQLRHSLARRFCLAASLLLISISFLHSDSTSEVSGIEKLLSVQHQVQLHLPKTQAAIVALECHGGTASGVIISPQGLVLTAAHVTRNPGEKVLVVLADGTTVQAESLGIDTATDAAMIQLPKAKRAWPHVQLQKQLQETKVGDWCYAVGHPGGFDKARGSVLRMGKILKHSANRLQSDCVLMGGDSGGGLFNLEGELIGINSQIWEGRDQNIHVSLAPFLRSWDELVKKAVIHRWDTGSGGFVGILTEFRDGKLWVKRLANKGPAEIAGIKEGEQIVALDGLPLLSAADFSQQILLRPVSTLLSLTLKNASQQERVVEVKLTKRPASP